MIYVSERVWLSEICCNFAPCIGEQERTGHKEVSVFYVCQWIEYRGYCSFINVYSHETLGTRISFQYVGVWFQCMDAHSSI